MNGTEVIKLLREIGSVRAITQKTQMLSEHKDDPLLRKVLMYALDPFKTYHMAKTTLPKPTHNRLAVIQDESSDVFEMLDDMVSGKLSGGAAIAHVQNVLEALDDDNGELLQRVILKDLKCGVGVTLVNKVFGKIIPVFDCMLAHKFEPTRLKKLPWLCEEKKDGFRALAFVDLVKQEVRFFSRSGIEYLTFDHLKQPIIDAFSETKHPEDAVHDYILQPQLGRNTSFVLDGEVQSGSFNKTSSELRRKNEQALDAYFAVFDIIPMSVMLEDVKEDKKGGTYKQRRKLLETYLAKEGSVRILPIYWINSHAEALNIYQNVRDRGGEGVIVKDPNACYQKKRSHAWLKIKNEETVDCPIVGAYCGEPGTKYAKDLGGFIVNYLGVKVRVGGGFSDDQRVEFMRQYEEDMKNANDPDYSPVLIGRVVEVEYHEITPDGSLRHPRFVRFRPDRDAERCEEEEGSKL